MCMMVPEPGHPCVNYVWGGNSQPCGESEKTKVKIKHLEEKNTAIARVDNWKLNCQCQQKCQTRHHREKGCKRLCMLLMHMAMLMIFHLI